MVSLRALMNIKMVDEIHRTLKISIKEELEMDHRIKVNAAENNESDFPAALGIRPLSVGIYMKISTTKNLCVNIPRV